MISSKDVFAERKINIDNAYILALQLVNTENPSEWDFKAFAWCLIDLIKRDSSIGFYQNLQHYADQLCSLNISPTDEVLTKSRSYVLSLTQPFSSELQKAKELSRAEKFSEAVSCYKQIIQQGYQDQALHTSYGWDQYRLIKQLLQNPQRNLRYITTTLFDYLSLNVEKPSKLHSLMLQMAGKLGDNFNFTHYLQHWNPELFQVEDYQPQHGQDGKKYDPLFERAIQQASKQANKNHDIDSLNFLLPYLTDAIERYPSNIWLIFYKAKTLLALGQISEAMSSAITIAKAKSNEFWAWELLGDCSQIGSDQALSCYCKALTCSSEINFTSKVKGKLASLLIQKELFGEAKYEVDQVIQFKQQSGQNITEPFSSLVQQAWYLSAISTTSNTGLYSIHQEAAESLLYSQLPWVKASLGEVYTILGKEHKPKQKLFIALTSRSIPIEISVPAQKFSFKQLPIGSALQVKAEYDMNGQLQVYTAQERLNGELWDIVDEKVGVIDHLNHEKKLVHCIISKVIQVTIPFSQLKERYTIGDSLALKLSKYTTKQGERFRALSVKRSEQAAPSNVRKEFYEQIEVNSTFGFTDNSIFVPPDLIKQKNIEDGDQISGVALLNYNRKRNEWGWKAISVNKENIIGSELL